MSIKISKSEFSRIIMEEVEAALDAGSGATVDDLLSAAYNQSPPTNEIEADLVRQLYDCIKSLTYADGLVALELVGALTASEYEAAAALAFTLYARHESGPCALALKNTIRFLCEKVPSVPGCVKYKQLRSSPPQANLNENTLFIKLK